ncbi:MAG: Respiratory-chain NADH dehydrogenase, 30 Kd subunit [Syntrophorhabdus sp. PtaU1.Bin002]|nr:MAG: Respiratory-chain NADH dehydrogenase, 30 Kd subunit [Syntrophorhabdus sp. PtaB.Bin006]OPY69318.1 MAG: Respiratory-chain NADH dehydrogenase, 30 Kd subunit [Syntrophorhabdus sp. PtaU1.Bin002]
MSEPQEIVLLGKNELVGVVAQLYAEGYRLVQIGCNTLRAAYELNYSFDKDYLFKNLRITVTPGEEVPSISAIYQNSFLYENEIHDLFGIAVTNISVDYHGTLYRTSIKTPFSVDNVRLPEPPKQKAEAPAQKEDRPRQQEAETEGPEGQKE